MRVSRERAEQNRRRILRAASRLFRENGIGSSGVDAITGEAGLTHGAFYSQFSSKEAVAVEAIRAASAGSRAHWKRASEGKRRADALEEIVHAYLARSHRDAPGQGCVLAALGAEVARQPLSVRTAFTEEVARSVDALADLLPGDDDNRRRDDATAALAWMSGALILARAVSDETLSARILARTAEGMRRLTAKRPRVRRGGRRKEAPGES